MTDSTNETVEAPKEQSAVEIKAAEVEAKRQELASLTTENTTASVDAEQALQIRQLENEEARIDTELAYQRRLKEAREAQSVDNLVPVDPAVTVEGGPHGGTLDPANPDAPVEEPVADASVPTPPATPVAPEAPVENVEASAKTSTKGK